MKRKIILISTVLFSLFFISSVKAFDPLSHYILANRFLDETNNQVANLCRNYRREFVGGAVAQDHSIAYYYLEGGKLYKKFHNWAYYFDCQMAATTNGEHCVCYGIGLGHYIPDSFAHNYYIPDLIIEWKHQNFYWHPIQEGRVAASLIREYPEKYRGLQDSLDIFFENPRYIEILQYAAGTGSTVNVEQNLLAFKTILGKNWIDVYKPGEDNWIGKYLWPSIATVVASMSDYEDAVPYFEKSLLYMDKIANDIDAYYAQCDAEACPRSPHGFDSLEAANAEVYSSTIIIGLIGLGILVLIVWRILKR